MSKLHHTFLADLLRSIADRLESGSCGLTDAQVSQLVTEFLQGGCTNQQEIDALMEGYDILASRIDHLEQPTGPASDGISKVIPLKGPGPVRRKK